MATNLLFLNAKQNWIVKSTLVIFKYQLSIHGITKLQTNLLFDCNSNTKYSLFHTKNYIFLFYQTTFLNEEVICTEPFPFSKGSLAKHLKPITSTLRIIHTFNKNIPIFSLIFNGKDLDSKLFVKWANYVLS